MALRNASQSQNGRGDKVTTLCSVISTPCALQASLQIFGLDMRTCSTQQKQKDADCGRAARIKITLNPKRIGSSAKQSLLYEKELGENREISSLLRKNCHSYTVIPY